MSRNHSEEYNNLKSTVGSLKHHAKKLEENSLKDGVKDLRVVVQKLLVVTEAEVYFPSIKEELDILITRIIDPLSGKTTETLPEGLKSSIEVFTKGCKQTKEAWGNIPSNDGPHRRQGVQAVEKDLKRLLDGFLTDGLHTVSDLVNTSAEALKQRTSKLATTKSVLKDALKLVAVSLGRVPAPGLTGAAAGLLEVINAIERTAANVEDINGLVEHVNRFQKSILSALQGKTDAEIHPMLRARLVTLQSSLAQIETTRKEMVDRHALRRFADRDEDSAFIRSMRETLRCATDEFLLEGNITMEFLLAEDVHRALLNELPVSKYARYDCGMRRGEQRLGCWENTRVEMLDTIHKWTRDPTSVSPMYWLKGLAGTGKSAIALSVAQRAGKDGTLAASFFFSRDEDHLNNPQLLITTIAYQLAYFMPSFKLKIVDAIKANRSAQKEQQSMQEQLQAFIIKPLKQVEPRPTTPLLIVLDGLDECNIDHTALKALIGAFNQQILTLNFTLKVLITSRPENYIKLAFEPLSPQPQSFSLQDIEGTLVQKDLNHFLSARLKAIAALFEIDPSEWPTKKELTDFGEKSANLFIYASTALQYIESDIYSDPRGQLTTLLGDEHSNSSAYGDLDNLYLMVLNTAVPFSTDNLLIKRFQAIVGAIVTVFDPQSVGCLEILLRRSDIRAGLTKLQSLFTVPPDDAQPIRFLHPSFYEFLTVRCPIPHFRINKSDQHALMAERCFAIMKAELKRDICGIEHLLCFNEEVADLQEKIQNFISPQLKYACTHWVGHWIGHMIHCTPPNNSPLLTQFDEFCQTKLLQWLEVCSLFGGSNALKSTSNAFTRLGTWFGDKETLISPRGLAALEFIKLVFGRTSSSPMKQASQVYSTLSEQPYEILKQVYKEDIPPPRGRKRVPVLDAWSVLPKSRHRGVRAESLSISPDGRSCAISFWDYQPDPKEKSYVGQLLLVRDTGLVSPLLDLPTVVQSTDFSPDGRQLASGSARLVQIWDTASGALLKSLAGHTMPVQFVKYSPDGRTIASSCLLGYILLWDSATGTRIALTACIDDFHLLEFSHQDPPLVVTLEVPRSVRLWNSTSGIPISTKLDPYIGSVNNSFNKVAISPDGAYVLAGSNQGKIELWGIADPVQQFGCSWGRRLLAVPAGVTGEFEVHSLGFAETREGNVAVVRYLNKPALVHCLGEVTSTQRWPAEDGGELLASNGWISRSRVDGLQRLLWFPFRVYKQASVGDVIVLLDVEDRSLHWFDFSAPDDPSHSTR